MIMERQYGPDVLIGDELDEDGRVWKVYRAEATLHDTTMLEGWHKTIDILLLFVRARLTSRFGR